jgi:hypothetical protein
MVSEALVVGRASSKKVTKELVGGEKAMKPMIYTDEHGLR